MKRKYLLLAIALGAAAGCGDNSHECGTGTTLDENGFCVGEATAECGEGTKLDPTTKTCVVDETICHNGTVYIPTKGCVDPTDNLVVDKAEGAEPNGLGIVEDSDTPAGVIVLKAVDQPYVIKGTINPFQDGNNDGEIDPDMDTYLLQVNAPTLIEVTVDGVNGLNGAFVALTDADNPAVGWRRFGLNLNGDMSKRLLWLPSAGAYGIAIGDTRSMFLDGDSPPAAGFGGAAGGPNATYYATITVKATPTPTALTVTNGTATNSGTLAVGDVKFFSVAMGLGYNNILLDFPGSASGSVVLQKNNAFRAQSDEIFDPFAGPLPAELNFAGFDTADTSVIVVDTTYHYGPEAAAYDLAVSIGSAQALSRTGGAVMQTNVSGVLPTTLLDLTRLATFYYDVAAADEIVGFNLLFPVGTDVVIVDDDLTFGARMTWDGFASGRTMTTYKGYIRHRHAGRFYLMGYVPGAAASTVTVTSTLTTTTPGAITLGTPLTAQAVNTTFESNIYSYAAGTVEPWQSFNSIGTATGNQTIRYFNPATAYGRLDDLTASTTPPVDAAPLFTTTHVQAGAAKGRILLDDVTTNYLVTVNTVTVAAATFDLDFKVRPHVDLGTIMAPGNVMRANEALTTAAPVQFYLMKTTNNNKVTLLVHPDGLTDDLIMRSLAPDETTRTPFGTVDRTAGGANETVTFSQAGNGWTAFAVSLFAAVPVAGTTFDLTDTVSLPPYGISAGATVFADACAGGAPVPMLPDNDEGAAAASTPTPAGFDFFGVPAPAIKIFANGFVSVNTATNCPSATLCFFSNNDMPNTAVPNGVIAPYWDDTVNDVCTKTMGTKLIIQWVGELFSDGTPTAFQLILDGSNDTIEFVYGPGHQANGISGTVGVENAAGDDAVKLSFNTSGSVSGAKKLTPQ